MADYSYLNNLKVAYFEVTNKCNLSCQYCYAIQRKLPKETLTFDVFADIIDKIAEHSSSEKITVIFHGGEPLLLEPSFYSQCLEYATDRFAERGKIADFGLQSNLTLLKDEMLPVLKKYNVGISTSIDGPEPLHNAARASWNKTVMNFDKIKQYGGIPINFIVVCSKHNHDKIESIFQFGKGMGCKKLQISIGSSVQRLEPASVYEPLSAEEILDVYKDIINNCEKYEMQEEKTGIMIRRFLAGERDFMHEYQCESPFCYAGTQMVVFTPNGKMYPCSPGVPLKLVGDDFSMGMFGDDSLTREKCNESILKFHNKGTKYEKECMECEASLICDFGCPAFDRIDPVTAQNKCEAIKQLYSYLCGVDKERLCRIVKE